jgi:hypothetical protein
MNHIPHDIRAAFYLLIGFVMLTMISAVAALDTVMRPMRWSERRSAQL